VTRRCLHYPSESKETRTQEIDLLVNMRLFVDQLDDVASSPQCAFQCGNNYIAPPRPSLLLHREVSSSKTMIHPVLIDDTSQATRPPDTPSICSVIPFSSKDLHFPSGETSPDAVRSTRQKREALASLQTPRTKPEPSKPQNPPETRSERRDKHCESEPSAPTRKEQRRLSGSADSRSHRTHLTRNSSDRAFRELRGSRC
jgi:hypothetical protein